MSEHDLQYPVSCAKCEVAKGYPFQVRTLPERPGHIEVKLRCRACGHEWIQMTESKN